MVSMAKGGTIVNSATLTSASNMTVSFAVNTSAIKNMAIAAGGAIKAMEKIRDPNLCNNRRGGPRSKIFCEVPVSVPHDYHTGRGIGKWFSWKDKNVR